MNKEAKEGKQAVFNGVLSQNDLRRTSEVLPKILLEPLVPKGKRRI